MILFITFDSVATFNSSLVYGLKRNNPYLAPISLANSLCLAISVSSMIILFSITSLVKLSADFDLYLVFLAFDIK